MFIKTYKKNINLQYIKIWATEDVHGGKSIFMVDGERWKLMRGMISPAFTSKNLKLMQDIVKESSQTLINHLDLISTKGKPFDIRPYLESYVMDVVLRAIFGTKVDSAGDPNNPIVAHSKEIFKVDFSLSRLIAVFAPNFAKLFGLTPLDKRASIFMTELSLRIITERRKHNVKRNDFIQYLISGNMNESEIKTIDDKKLCEYFVKEKFPLFLSCSFFLLKIKNFNTNLFIYLYF